MRVYYRRPAISNLAAILTICTTLSVRADDASSPPISRTNRPAAPQGLVRPAQFGVRSRYPFAESRGAYRYPYSYPYYRYGGRQYPFGNGPYGPYGSNYGGYSGNPYSSGIYGSPFAGPYGEVFGDVQSAEETEELDPPPPPASRPPPGAPEAAYPGRAVISPHSPQADEEVDEGPGGMPGLPNQEQSFYDSQAYGEPLSYFGASPWNPSFGSGNLYRVYPYYNQNNMWFGNPQIQGFGYYPFQVYAYPYGPPSGAGYYSPEYAPQYYSMRNYGPYYPGLSGIKGGAGMCVGW